MMLVKGAAQKFPPPGGQGAPATMPPANTLGAAAITAKKAKETKFCIVVEIGRETKVVTSKIG